MLKFPGVFPKNKTKDRRIPGQDAMDMKSIILLIFKLLIVGLFLGPFLRPAHALDELFNLYDSPQGLAMGNAFTADATGYAANYYNPAGLAKGTLSRWEVTIVAADGMMALGGLGTFIGAQSFATHRIHNELAQNGGGYYYSRANLMASIQKKGFGFALLGYSELAERSNGETLDIRWTKDLAPTFGFAQNFAGNLIKLGITGKAIFRKQIEGVYNHAELATEAALDTIYKDGLGLGFDAGLLITLPNKFLPSFGFVVKDVLNTTFNGPSRVWDANDNGRPSPIFRSYNAAFSVHPHFAYNIQATVAAEFKHIERTDLPWQKRFHFGVQMDLARTWFFWTGLNQMYVTGGLGLRLKGGNFEMGTYAVDIGPGTARDHSRRMFMRYTIGF